MVVILRSQAQDLHLLEGFSVEIVQLMACHDFVVGVGESATRPLGGQPDTANLTSTGMPPALMNASMFFPNPALSCKLSRIVMNSSAAVRARSSKGEASPRW